MTLMPETRTSLDPVREILSDVAAPDDEHVSGVVAAASDRAKADTEGRCGRPA